MQLRKIITGILPLVWLLNGNCLSQFVPACDTGKTYGFEIPGKDSIILREELANTLEKLYRLKQGSQETLSILHIGDSHLQADFFSGMIRTTLQQEFGNAGRGLIVPLKVARTNEPVNYRTSSNTTWNSKRCVFPDQPLPVGIGGVTIQTPDSAASFSLKTIDFPPLSYAFDIVTLFYLEDSTSYDFNITDSAGHNLGMITSATADLYPNQGTLLLPALTNNITIVCRKNNPLQSQATLFGISLENDQPGIIYHTVGVNGARFRHYSAARYFCEQTRALSPDVIFISLGTNEANDPGFTQDEFYMEIQTLFNHLREQNPSAEFILTTPADSYYLKRRQNKRMPLVAETITRFAKNNLVPCWDLQAITGGHPSAMNWKKHGLLRPDGIHFTREGYELQGRLFCIALFNALNAYVAGRDE